MWYLKSKCTKPNCEKIHACPFCDECGDRPAPLAWHLRRMTKPETIVPLPGGILTDASKTVSLQCIRDVIEGLQVPAFAQDWEMPTTECCAVNDLFLSRTKYSRDEMLTKNFQHLKFDDGKPLSGKVKLSIDASLSYGRPCESCPVSGSGEETISMQMLQVGGHRFVIGLLGADKSGKMDTWWEKIKSSISAAAGTRGLSVSWVPEDEKECWEVRLDGAFRSTGHACDKETLDKMLQKVMQDLENQPVLLLDPSLPNCPVIGLSPAAEELTNWGEFDLEDEDIQCNVRCGAYGIEEEEDEERRAVRAACCNGRPCLATFRKPGEFPDEEPVFMKLQGMTLGTDTHVKDDPTMPCAGKVWYVLAVLGMHYAGIEHWGESNEVAQTWGSVMEAIQKGMDDNLMEATRVSYSQYEGKVVLLKSPIWHKRVQVNRDMAAGDPTKAIAVKCIKDCIESCDFPALANDWGLAEHKCIAMNDAYEKSKQCPKDRLIGKNNRTLDPSIVNMPIVPADTRLGIRQAMAYGLRFETHFVSTKNMDRDIRFMKHISMRTVSVGNHRFIFGLQFDFDETTVDSAMHERFVSAKFQHNMHWKNIEKSLAQQVNASGLQTVPYWIGEEDTKYWEPTSLTLEKTTDTCQKEQLDRVMSQAFINFTMCPVVLLDPILPECPVIAMNRAAQVLTGWDEITTASNADKVLEQINFAGGGGGAYHLNYGAYTYDEMQEKLSVHAACANGRPCLARFRDMYEFPSKDPIYMKLQGVTLSEGSGSGPLNGAGIWYLIGVLGRNSVSDSAEHWAEGKEVRQGWASLQSVVQQVMDQRETLKDVPMPPKDSPHPYGGRVTLLSKPMWHQKNMREPLPNFGTRAPPLPAAKDIGRLGHRRGSF